jgi:hypothetical protein
MSASGLVWSVMMVLGDDVVARRVFVRDGKHASVIVLRPQPFDDAAADWYVDVRLVDEDDAEIWSSRVGGIDAVQALTLALVRVGDELAAERVDGHELTFLGETELGFPVTVPSTDGRNFTAQLMLYQLGPAAEPR